MKVTFLTHTTSNASGGVAETVRMLSRSLVQAESVSVLVASSGDSLEAEEAAKWSPITVTAFRPVGLRSFGFSPKLREELLSLPGDLVHVHGLWSYEGVAAMSWSAKTHKPYLISPHGMLEPWAMQQSRVKKWFACRLYQRRALEQAACLCATSQMEADNIRKAGYSNPIAIIPNGVDADWYSPTATANPDRTRQVLFLSRIHPKKGLLNLVNAWEKVRPHGWRLTIAGPDERGHLKKVMDRIKALGLEEQIVYAGTVGGHEKLATYRGSNLFVLPSFSENFGLVVAEALACGVPVITTRATPWGELVSEHCGWWIGTDEQSLVTALKAATSLSPDVLRSMGQRGCKLMRQKYAWSSIARLMAQVYQWLVGVGPRPSCVQFAI